MKLVRGLLVSSITLLLLGVGAWLFLRTPDGRIWLKTTFRHPVDGYSGRVAPETLYTHFALDRIGHHFEIDPVAYLVPKPNVTEAWDWPEHADGRITFVTNDRGLREDEPLREKVGRRILVAGDSHTSGVVPNHESFANLLEARLAALDGWQGTDVVNAGVPYTGPACYLGMLEKHLELQPDIFIAVLFTGNDFTDDLRLRYLQDGWSFPLGDDGYRAKVRRANEEHPGGLHQGFNQAARLEHFPRERDQALQAVIDSYVAMAELCQRENIQFYAAILPTKMDVDTNDAETREALFELLAIDEQDLAVNRDLGRRCAAELESRGIAVIDLLEPMQREERPLYWSKDCHLSTLGHERVAELLFEELTTGH